MPTIEIQQNGLSRSLKFDSAITIGRDAACDVVLDDRRCSKTHLEIEPNGRQWRARDLGSANGTRVNGQEISAVALTDGDVLEIGEARIVFSSGRVGETGEGAKGERKRAESGRRRGQSRVVTAALLVGVLGIAAWLLRGGKDEPKPAVQPSAPDEAMAAPGAAVTTAGAEAATAETERLWQERRATLAGLDPDLALARIEEWAADGAAALPAAALQEERRHQFERVAAELQSRAESTLTGAEADLAAGRFGVVLSRFDELVIEARGRESSALEAEIRRRRLEVIRRARTAYDALHAQALGFESQGRFGEAIAAIEAALPGFRGTGFEGLLSSDVALFTLGRERPQAPSATVTSGSGDPVAAVAAPPTPKSEDTAPGVSKPAVEKSPPRRSARGEKVAAEVAAAEQLATQRDWSGAEKAFAALVESLDAAEPLRAGFERRRDTMAAFARLKAAVAARAAAGGGEGAAQTLRLGKMTARLVTADEEGLRLRTGRGEISWAWKEVPADRLADVLAIGRTPGDGDYDLALVARELGDPARAEAALVAALEAQPGRKSAVDVLVAAWRGIAVPAGGFVVGDGAFHSPEEWEDLKLAAEGEKLGRTLAQASRDKVAEIVARMKVLGRPATGSLAKALASRYERVSADLRRLPAYQQLDRGRTKVNAVLDERRKAALELIFDAKRYPYPYGPDQAKVQAEVDALVARVQAIYEHPSEVLRAEDERLAAGLAELSELAGAMPEDTNGRRLDPADLLRELDAALDMRLHGRSPADRKWNDEVFAFNAEIKSSITPEERGVHDVTNEYRLMMGMRAVKIDEALVLAARGHSQEMFDLKYFAHESPTPEKRTPSMRAQLAGWSGGCSENIEQGASTPEAAVRGWLSSSGHHRNILGRGHTHLGVGKSVGGLYWTQNFASGSSSRISLEKIEKAPSAPGR